jgi:hypothetical protein
VAKKGPKNISLKVNGDKNSDVAGSDSASQQGQNTNFGQDNTNAPETEEITDDNGEKIIIQKGDLDPGNIRSASGDEFAHITTEHCNSGCEAFANKLDYFEYCQQVCGITPVKDVKDCDGKDGLEKDYCLKDLGITKGDKSICGDIKDANVQKTCQNRITQDQIEEQMSGGNSGPVD